MLDFTRNVSKLNSQEYGDIFANCQSAQEITDAFQQELARAIADSQDVKPVLASAQSCEGVFGKIDTSGDGSLSRDEAIAALMPVVGDPDIAERVYGVLDPKGEGQVSKARFEECLDTVIKVTSFEAHLTITEMSETTIGGVSGEDFRNAVDGLRNQDGISGRPVSMDAFWMKLMEELEKNRKGEGTAPAKGETAVAAQATASGAGVSGATLSMQSATYAEASISVETVSANLGAVFSAMA